MADKKIKFVNITKTDSGNFVNLVNLARARKINSDTIVKVVGYSDRLVLEVWRREGGIDMFHTPTNDVFDRISVKKVIEMSGTTYFAKSAPIGALLANNLTESVKCDIFLSEQIVTENVFVKIMAGICRNYGYNFDELQLRENRYIVPETIIEF